METNETLDNTVEAATEVLEGLLEAGCSWFVSTVKSMKEKQAQKEEVKSNGEPAGD